MTDIKGRRILWVDDQIEGLKPFASALEEAGFSVTCASSYDEAMTLVKGHPFDVILVDIRMPAPDGIELVRQIHPVQKKAHLAVLSSYLYLPLYRERLRQLNFVVQLMDKDIPRVGAPDFESRFIAPVRLLAEQGVTETIQMQEERLEISSSEDPFNIPLAEFMAKSIVEKDRLQDLAEEMAAPLLNRAFKEGKMWVLLCGSKDQERASASKQSEIPPVDEVMKFARVQDRAPFLFLAPLNVEEFWQECGTRASLEDYPTVTLEFGDEGVNFHFDTGSPTSFMSYEELTNRMLIPSGGPFIKGWRGNKYFRAANMEFKVILRCQAGRDETHQVKITGFAVRDWFNSPFSRMCEEECKYIKDESTKESPRPCPRRIGLVGRNILTENKLRLILDGGERKTILG